jgi:hypothetical protein
MLSISSEAMYGGAPFVGFNQHLLAMMSSFLDFACARFRCRRCHGAAERALRDGLADAATRATTSAQQAQLRAVPVHALLLTIG